MKSQACAVAIRVSKSLAKRRLRLSQARVRSTTHRRGRTSKPWASLGRLTISRVHRPIFFQGCFEFGSGIGAVGDDVAQPRKGMADGSEQGGRAVAVLDVGGVDLGGHQQAAGIGENVTLAALDLLTCVEALWAAAFRGFYALAVNDAGRRAGLAPFGLACRHQEMMIGGLPDVAIPPSVEVALHRRSRREMLRQHGPGTTAAQLVQRNLEIHSNCRSA